MINSDKWWFNIVVQYGGSIVIDGASYYGLSSGLEGANKLIFIFPYTSIYSRFNWKPTTELQFCNHLIVVTG